VPAAEARGDSLRAAEMLCSGKEAFAKDMDGERVRSSAEGARDVQEASDMPITWPAKAAAVRADHAVELPEQVRHERAQSIALCGMITPWNLQWPFPFVEG